MVDSPHFAPLDEKGAFSIPSVPDGKVTLKIWTRGQWAYQEEIDTAKKDDLSIHVASPKDREPAGGANE